MTAGRAAVVVPDGILFGDGVCARIKQELLTHFRLHTVVRMPNGSSSLTLRIPTNILFFDASGPTEQVWFYKLVPPGGRKHYTKTKPLQFPDFGEVLQWWKRRRASDCAWKMSLATNPKPSVMEAAWDVASSI